MTMLDYVIAAIVIFAILDVVFMVTCIRVSDDIHTRKVSAPDETDEIIEERGELFGINKMYDN